MNNFTILSFPKLPRHWKKASLLVGLIFLVNQLSFDPSTILTRELASVTQDEQMFQVTLTGVPNRVPTVMEYMYLEGVLYDYLRGPSAPTGIRVSSVRAAADKTIHYHRSLLDEKFTVMGDQFTSNGDVEIDSDTMSRIDNTNTRVLSQGHSSIHQLSLLITIKGTYRTSSALDFDTLIMTALNNGQTELVNKLVNPPSDTQAADYFKDLEFFVCIGVGPRDSDPFLEMANMGKSSNVEPSSTSTNTSTNDSTQEQQQGQTFADLTKSLKSGTQSQARSIDGEKGVRNGRSYDIDLESDRPEDDTTSSSSAVQAEERADEPEKKKKIVISPSYYDSDGVFNNEAAEFRLISGFIFLLLCVIAVLYNVIRILAKKNAERKRRLTLAKKVYEGPRKESKVGKTFFKSSKYTGTMDTGTGLQDLDCTY